MTDYVIPTGIGIDSTDHFAFLCLRCKKPMEVVNVTTTGEKNKCTFIILSCKNCDLNSQRKIYWKGEYGKFLRTFFIGDKND